jgi:hypothetical protein
MYDFLANAPTPPRNHANSHLSSPGILERQIKYELDDFWIGVSSATPEVTLYIWTFQNSLTLALWFNPAYHQREDIMNSVSLHLHGCS